MRHCALPKAAILAVLLLMPARQSNAIVLIDDGAGAYLCQAYYVMDSYQGTDCWYWGYGGGSGGGGDDDYYYGGGGGGGGGSSADVWVSVPGGDYSVQVNVARNQVRTDDISCSSDVSVRQVAAGRIIVKNAYLKATVVVTVFFSDGKQTFQRLGAYGSTFQMVPTSDCVAE